MNNSKVLLQYFISRVTLDDTVAEIESIGYCVLESVMGLSRNDVLTNREVLLDDETKKKLHAIITRINTHEPVQYVLGEAEFFGRKFNVNDSVLIPRPETEELLQEVVYGVKQKKDAPIRILDIGTGSGCIPITLALEVPGSEIFATEVSKPALAVARQNSENLHARVTFFENDILKEDLPVNDLDMVISNPPYITLAEKESMARNVTDFEPHLALFVPGNDPLLFYRAIAQKSRNALRPSGILCVEINERFGKEVAILFREYGFDAIEIIQDINGKDRSVIGKSTRA